MHRGCGACDPEACHKMEVKVSSALKNKNLSFTTNIEFKNGQSKTKVIGLRGLNRVYWTKTLNIWIFVNAKNSLIESQHTQHHLFLCMLLVPSQRHLCDKKEGILLLKQTSMGCQTLYQVEMALTIDCKNLWFCSWEYTCKCQGYICEISSKSTFFFLLELCTGEATLIWAVRLSLKLSNTKGRGKG